MVVWIVISVSFRFIINVSTKWVVLKGHHFSSYHMPTLSRLVSKYTLTSFLHPRPVYAIISSPTGFLLNTHTTAPPDTIALHTKFIDRTTPKTTQRTSCSPTPPTPPRYIRSDSSMTYRIYIVSPQYPSTQ